MKIQFFNHRLNAVFLSIIAFTMAINGVTLGIFAQGWVRSSELLLTSIYDEILTNNERALRYKLDRASALLSLNKVTIYEVDKLNEDRRHDHFFPSYKISLPIYSNVGSKSGYLGEIRFYFSTQEIFISIFVELLSISLFGGFIYFYSKKYFEQKLKLEMLTQRKLELGELAAKMAHDIRSPLSLLMAVSSQNAQDNESSSKFIKIAVDRINAIAEDLLAKRKSSNQVEIVSDFYSVLNEILDEKKIEVGAHESLEIIAKIPASRNMPALGNANEIKRIISNLINNSRESLAEDKRIEISAFVKNEHFWVIVKDYGKGIPNEILQKLGTQEVTSKSSGNGLGLLYAKKYLERVKGGLKIESDLGKGTTVSLYFQRL